MTANLLNLAAIACYLITWAMVILRLRSEINNPDKQISTTKFYFLPWLLALLLHIAGIHLPLSDGNQLAFNFISLGSYVMWFISLVLFITTLSRKIESLAVIILPFAILSILILMSGDTDSDKVINMRSGLGVHILVSLLAYSILMLASFQALLLAVQNHHLHSRHHGRQSNNLIRTLPSLEDMEHFLFRLLALGVILLSLSLLSGFYFLDNLFGSQVAHKTILSIISWVIFSFLLFGRWKYGWRGKIAVRWTLTGFVVLALAFFGSKFIQEFVLDKSPEQNSYLSHSKRIS